MQKDKKDTVNPERRRSERQKKDTTMTTSEINERMAKKRNLEGNNTSTNSFAGLSIEEVNCLANKMGVIFELGNFNYFDMLKDLEIARNNLYFKKTIFGK